jgi:hypothetical protein
VIYYEIPDYFSLFLAFREVAVLGYGTGICGWAWSALDAHEFIGISRSGKRVRDDGSHGVKQKKIMGYFWL